MGLKKEGFIFLLGVIFLTLTVLAASTVTKVIFNNNATSSYDEGSFFVNWTPGGDVAANYSIYIFSNDTFYLKATNDSETGYSFSNTTESNYTFIIEPTNANGTVGINSTNISIYVDSTPPTISLPVYVNATSKKNSSTLTLNISVTDSLSGLTSSNCLIDVNSTNQSISYSSGWCNGTIGLTGLNDGNHTLNVWVNDSVNNFGLNNSFIVQTDTTAPSISVSCSPSSIYTGNNFPCSCSGTDSISGVSTSSGSSNSPEGINNPSSTGTFTYTCSVTDNAGNIGTSSTSYTVSSQGGGSSIIPPSSKSISFLWDKISSGRETEIQNLDKEIPLEKISFWIKDQTQNVKITITSYYEKPEEISLKEGKVYKYLHFDTINLLKNLDSAEVIFRVNKTWISQNLISKEGVSIYRFNEENKKWEEIKTDFQKEDSLYYYYLVNLDSFSYFAISEKEIIPQENNASENVETFQKPLEELNTWWIWVLGVLILGGIIWLLINKRKKVKKYLKFGY